MTTEKQSAILTAAFDKLSMANTLQNITKIVAEAARALTGADGATFVLRENNLCYYVDEDSISPLWKSHKFPMEACISGWSMIHGEVVTIKDIYKDSRIPIEAYRPTFVKSLCMVPVRPEKSIAAIGNYWSQEHTPSKEDIKVLQILANSTAIALENFELKKTTVGQSFKNKELEAAMYSLGHDLRNPVCAMVSLADLLKAHMGNQLNPTTTEFLNMMIQTGRRASEQIERMLSLYKATNGKIEKRPVDLSTIATDVVVQMRRQYPDRRILATIQEDLRTYADQRLIHMVLENLLSNAVKYSSRKPESKIEVGSTADVSGNTLFFVRDNGDGFDNSDVHKLFKPLGRLHLEEEFAGTGLGLASVAKIVELHGGRVHAEGKKAEGATFFFSLPNA